MFAVGAHYYTTICLSVYPMLVICYTGTFPSLLNNYGCVVWVFFSTDVNARVGSMLLLSLQISK